MPKTPRPRAALLENVLTAKLPGRHRPVLNAVYPLSDNEANAAINGAGQTELDVAISRLVVIPVVMCVDCNQPYAAVRGVACDAPDILAEG